MCYTPMSLHSPTTEIQVEKNSADESARNPSRPIKQPNSMPTPLHKQAIQNETINAQCSVKVPCMVHDEAKQDSLMNEKKFTSRVSYANASETKDVGFVNPVPTVTSSSTQIFKLQNRSMDLRQHLKASRNQISTMKKKIGFERGVFEEKIETLKQTISTKDNENNELEREVAMQRCKPDELTSLLARKKLHIEA